MDYSKDKASLKLLVIVGLPGSGKTTYLHRLVRDGIIVDYCDDYEFGPLKRVAPSLTDKDNKLLAGLRKGQAWAIADTRYCDKRERDKLEHALHALIPGLNIEFQYFENSPELCEQNAIKREGGSAQHQINLIYYYTELYNIPEQTKIIRVYGNS